MTPHMLLAPRFSWLAGALLSIAPWAVRADEGVTINLSPEAASELHSKLANAPRPAPLEVLGITDAAEYHPVIPVPMRDGVHLSANVILPRAGRGPWPVILIRSPYDPAAEVSEPLAIRLLPELVRHGYAIAIVNDRGTQWSEGSYHWLRGANRDGWDALEWVSHQSWSSGRIGTFGCSSSAESQPPLATLNHPAHRAMVEMGGGTAGGELPGYHGQGIFYHGGVPDLAWTWWYHRFGHLAHPQFPPGLDLPQRERLALAYSPNVVYGDADFELLASHLPSEDILRAIQSPDAEWNRMIRFTPASPEWAEYDFVRTGASTRVPGLHIDSWYDSIEAYPTVRMFAELTRHSPNQHLIIGPTAHCRMGTETEHTSVGDREVGDGRFDYVSLIEHWYDRWLKDMPAPEPPPVQYYVLSANEWVSASQWPPHPEPGQRFYLQSAGHANSASGDGQLLTQEPQAGEPPDQYVSDPSHPVPSRGGSCCSEAVAREQSPVEARADVLIYSTPALEHPLRLVGEITAHLYVSSSAPDTDLMLKLVDVYPDGSAYNVGDTALRLRYRTGEAQPSRLQPGIAYPVAVTGLATAAELPAGHRLRIEIASSNFPNYERNLQSGGRNFDEAQPHIARNQIWHDSGHLSYLEIPVVSTTARP
jgi:uncharacterized protein